MDTKDRAHEFEFKIDTAKVDELQLCWFQKWIQRCVTDLENGGVVRMDLPRIYQSLKQSLLQSRPGVQGTGDAVDIIF